MSAMLRSYFGYPDERVIVMTDDNNTISIPPTRHNVDKAMLNLVKWAEASAASGMPATLWIYGCFATDLGDDGILRLQEQVDDRYFTRDQFWRFLRMLPNTTRVICLIDGPTCNGIRSAAEENSVYRYTGRRTQCAGRPIEIDQTTPDLMFIFGDRSLHTVRGTTSPPIDEASQKSKRKRRGSMVADSDDEDDWGYLSDSGPIVDSNDLPEHRITNVFTTALQRYDQRLSCTTLLRKMAAIARKARRDFVPVIETTRPLDPVRPFSATIDDRPLMMVTASMGAGGVADTEEHQGGAFSLL
jgi:hypothetical protein